MANESKTLKNAAVGATVKVKKLTGDGPVKKKNHGHGYHKRRRDLCKKGSTTW